MAVVANDAKGCLGDIDFTLALTLARSIAGLHQRSQAHQGGGTELVCGVFLLRNTKRNPLVDALPRVLHTDVSGRDGGKTLELLTELLVSELSRARAGHAYMASRLIELFCAEAVRQYLDHHTHEAPGWFRAMRDPRIGPALNVIHAFPGSDLGVAALASEVNMSASRFAARFRETMGQSVMHYATGWRMNVAARLLSDADLSVEQIAHRVGYDSAPAFTRAFARNYECSPSAYRQALRSAST